MAKSSKWPIKTSQLEFKFKEFNKPIFKKSNTYSQIQHNIHKAIFKENSKRFKLFKEEEHVAPLLLSNCMFRF